LTGELTKGLQVASGPLQQAAPKNAVGKRFVGKAAVGEVGDPAAFVNTGQPRWPAQVADPLGRQDALAWREPGRDRVGASWGAGVAPDDAAGRLMLDAKALVEGLEPGLKFPELVADRLEAVADVLAGRGGAIEPVEVAVLAGALEGGHGPRDAGDFLVAAAQGRAPQSVEVDALEGAQAVGSEAPNLLERLGGDGAGGPARLFGEGLVEDGLNRKLSRGLPEPLVRSDGTNRREDPTADAACCS
jgi:hypothetical protein